MFRGSLPYRGLSNKDLTAFLTKRDSVFNNVCVTFIIQFLGVLIRVGIPSILILILYHKERKKGSGVDAICSL
jgi:hypothetical protein